MPDGAVEPQGPDMTIRRPDPKNPKHPESEELRDGLFQRESVKRWLRGISEDSHYKQVNVLHRFLLYRERRGFEADPDRLIEECRKGTNQTRIDHLQTA